MGGCKKCMKISGILALVIGVVLLIHLFKPFLDLPTADVGVTLLFLMMGVGSLTKGHCKDCMAMCGTDKKMK